MAKGEEESSKEVLDGEIWRKWAGDRPWNDPSGAFSEGRKT